MRPRFNTMTVAELRAYCAHLNQVGIDAHTNQQDILELLKKADAPFIPDAMIVRLVDNVRKLEVLGLHKEKDDDG